MTRLAQRRRAGPALSSEAGLLKDLEAKRTVLRSLLDLPAGHRTWDLYDRQRTLSALDRLQDLPLQGRVEVHHAATVATWLDHGEQRADVYEPTD